MSALCPYCNQPTVKRLRPFKVRRGDRVLELELNFWECDRCPDEDGYTPFAFQDGELGREHDEWIKQAWLETFGEPLPPSGRRR